MYNGIVILEQWQENKGLIDELLEKGVISKFDNECEINRAWVTREYFYCVQSDFFPEVQEGRVLPTARVIDDKLVQSAYPITVFELEDAQRFMSTFKEEKALLEKEVRNLKYEEDNLKKLVQCLQEEKKANEEAVTEAKQELHSIKQKLRGMDKPKIDIINDCLDSIVYKANNLEVQATTREINSFFNAIQSLKNIINGEDDGTNNK